MAKCYLSALPFPRLEGRRVEVEFSGSDITRNGGSPRLRQVDRRIGLSDAVARYYTTRGATRAFSTGWRHWSVSACKRWFLGYENLNDHETLRHDAGLQTAAPSRAALASSATLCRWEQTVTRGETIGLHQVLFDQFMAAQRRRPEAVDPGLRRDRRAAARGAGRPLLPRMLRSVLLPAAGRVRGPLSSVGLSSSARRLTISVENRRWAAVMACTSGESFRMVGRWSEWGGPDGL